MPVILLLISIALIILLTTRFQLHPFLTLFVVAILYALLSGMPLPMLITSINEGFGGTLAKVGLIIVFGVLIGTFLENSGGAYVLAEKVLNVIGRKRITSSMAIIGYFVSIPVFADSGYLLMSPLAKSLSRKAAISLTGPAIALGLGLTTSHVMVPPTPGPIAAAGILGADLGLVMLIGIPVSLLTLIPSVVFASKYAARTFIQEETDPIEVVGEKRSENPGIVKASLPVLIPIILIVTKSIAQSFPDAFDQTVFSVIGFIGEPVVALFAGALLALLLPAKFETKLLSSTGWVGDSLRSAASIILITGAGGIFGKILQNSGISEVLGESLSGARLGIWLPFLIAAALKTAQGSSTVALITAASIISPLMADLGFDTPMEKALVVLAIGAGSAVVSHANDSFFWVVTQLSGFTVNTSYRLFTLGTLIMGTTAALLIFLASLILV